MDSITLGGQTYQPVAPWHPLRIRLHSALTSTSGDGTDSFAVICAVIGACVTEIDGCPTHMQREHLRRDAIDYGEGVMDRLMEKGVSLEEMSSVGIALATKVFDATPTDEEVEEAVDFTQDPPETFTVSM